MLKWSWVGNEQVTFLFPGKCLNIYYTLCWTVKSVLMVNTFKASCESGNGH